MFWRSWVRILALYTGWTWQFFTLICCNNCIVCLKRPKINKKEAGVGPILKTTISMLTTPQSPCQRWGDKNKREVSTRWSISWDQSSSSTPSSLPLCKCLPFKTFCTHDLVDLYLVGRGCGQVVSYPSTPTIQVRIQLKPTVFPVIFCLKRTKINKKRPFLTFTYLGICASFR